MKKIFSFIFLYFTCSAIYAQNITPNACQNAQSDASVQSSTISAGNTQISNIQSFINVAQTKLNADNQTIADCNAYNATTAATVNWEDIDTLEIGGIRYAQWSVARNSIPWSTIVPTLDVGGAGCTVSETSVNWNNFGSCVSNGLNMNQPYGNWPYGISAFWCGSGKVTGTC
jgi:hypothetical protein